MGKITKHENDRPSEIEFHGNKFVAIRVTGAEVNVYELGLFDAELRKICSKDIKLFDQVIKILEESEDIDGALLRLNNLYLDGERRTVHEKEVTPEEAIPEMVKGAKLPREPLRRWDFFQNLARFFYGTLHQDDIDTREAKKAVFEVLAAYVDPEHSFHKPVREFLSSIEIKDPFYHPRDGLWILRDMIAKLMPYLKTEKKQKKLQREFRKAVTQYRRTLRNRFHDPLPYLNDIDGAELRLEEAEGFAAAEDLEEALACCLRAVDAAPNYVDGYYRAVQYYILLENYDAAVSLLESVKHMPMASKILAHHRDYYLLFKTLCLKIPDPEKAKSHLEYLKTLASKYHIDLDELTEE